MNKFDNMYDINELVQECDQMATQDAGDFDNLPDGEYEVKCVKCELTESKSSGKPMVAIWYKVLVGELKDRLIFNYNVVDEPKKIYWTMRRLGQLAHNDLKFVSYTVLEEICNGIQNLEPELIVELKTKGDWQNVNIKEVFE